MKSTVRLWATALPLAAAFFAGVNPTSAATFTYSGYSVPGEQTISITSPTNVYGGMGQIDLQGSAPSSAGLTIMAWCLDVYTYLLGDGYGGPPPFTYNISQLTPATSAIGFGTSDTPPSSEIGTLTASQIGEIGGLIAYGNANISAPNVSAGTQLAIWETEYGTTNFQFSGVSSDTITQAANEMADVSPDFNVALLTAVAGESNQTLAYDFNILGTPLGVDPSPTPLPGTLPLFAAGLGAMGLFGWRGRRLRLIMSTLVA